MEAVRVVSGPETRKSLEMPPENPANHDASVVKCRSATLHSSITRKNQKYMIPVATEEAGNSVKNP
jgi:hypothetical protein